MRASISVRCAGSGAFGPLTEVRHANISDRFHSVST